MVAKGAVFALSLNLNKYTAGLFLVSCFLFLVSFGWFEIRGFYNINNPAMVEAGRAVDQLTPPDALVIAPYGGDTAFLYQTNRRGWPIGGNIETRILQGATHYVTTSMDAEAQELASRYQVIAQTANLIIIQF
jgi:hypothetical protein